MHNFGVELEVVTAAPQSPAVGMTVSAIERQAKGAFFVVQINRRDGDVFTAPPPAATVGEGDGVVLIGRPNRSAILTALFGARVRGRPWLRHRFGIVSFSASERSDMQREYATPACSAGFDCLVQRAAVSMG